MSELAGGHLSPAQIIAAAARELNDAESAAHLKSCDECCRNVQQWSEALEDFAPLRQVNDAAPPDEQCPTSEALANYYAGSPDETSAAILLHLAQCGRCAAIVNDLIEADEPQPVPILRSSTSAWRRDMVARILKKSATPNYWRYVAAAAVLIIVVGGALWWNIRSASAPVLLLAKAYTAARPFEYRLPDDGYGPVRQERGAGSAFNRPQSLLDAEVQLQQRLSGGRENARDLDLQGRAELLERNYDAAVSSLSRASLLRPNDPDVLVDLGCAYALKSDVEGQSWNYGLALQQFLKALTIEPSNQSAWFNLAIVYEKRSDVDSAIEAWRKFIALKPPPGWAGEAYSHLEKLETILRKKEKADKSVLKDPAAFLAARRANAAFDPDLYHEVFWQAWLPASISNRDAREASRSVARGFLRKFHDASLQDTFVRLQRFHGQTTLVENALTQLSRAITFNREGQGDRAANAAERAAEPLDRAGLKAAAMRARIEWAYALRRASMYSRCQDLTTKVVSEASARQYSWLSGDAHLEHAMCSEPLGRPADERLELQNAQTALEQTGLRLLALRALGLITGTDNLIGNYAAVWDKAPQGLAEYWRSAASPYRAQQFHYDLQTAAVALGWRETAVVMGRVAAEFAGRAGNPEMEAADHIEVADLLSESIELQEKRREIERAKALVRLLPPGPTLDDLQWTLDVRSAAAEVAAGNSKQVVSELDQLAADRQPRNPRDLMLLQQARGLALVELGDLVQASAAFQRVIEWNQKKTSALPSYTDRVAELGTAAESYRRLTQIQLLNDRDEKKALATWRLYRGGLAAPQANPLITYAVLPAGIAVWMDDGGSVRSRLVEAPIAEVSRECLRFVQLCASPGSNETEIREAGHKLFRWLIGPELSRTGARCITLQPDSFVSSISFGALVDDSGNYLVRSYSFQHGSGEEACSPDQIRFDEKMRALIIAAPLGRAPGGRLLPVLASATAESAAVARRFSKPVVLRDESADDSAIASYSPVAEIFHFAGHGWAIGGNGALVLPPSPNGESRFITSKELANQDWSRCRLAVLSACLTAAGEERGAVDNQSLVRAMLSAGARHVMAARWSVDSEATRALMDHFYARLFEGFGPSKSLAAAASDLSRDSRYRHPYYWAAFDIFEKS